MVRNILLASLVVLLIGLPLAAILVDLIAHPSAWDVWSEGQRLWGLLRNTLLLAGGTVLLTVPAGTVLGFLLFRTDLPARRLLRGMVALSLFVPLPVFASAWQELLSIVGWGPEAIFLQPSDDESVKIWTAWNRGLTAAIVVHAAAALPWVIWLTGIGFARVDRAAEEDALTSGGAAAACRRVAIPGAATTIALAALWVAVHASSEIGVTDMMQVRTYAEEVYAQFSRPDPDSSGGTAFALSRSVAIALPPTLLLTAIAFLLLSRLHHAPLTEPHDSRPLYRFKSWRWPIGLVVAMALVAISTAPVGSLIALLGRTSPSNVWSATTAFDQLGRAWEVQHTRIGLSIAAAVATGVVVTLTALAICYAARRSPLWRLAALTVTAVLWTIPGPVLGWGLKDAIGWMIDLEEWATGSRIEVVRTWLYDGPSPLPVMWAAGLRAMPAALVMIWPGVRAMPVVLEDAARTDGASSWMTMRHVALSSLYGPASRTVMVVTALALGELSASRLVQTPAGHTFAQEIFMQMHFGVNNHLAAMCLILLAVVALNGGAVFLVTKRRLSP